MKGYFHFCLIYVKAVNRLEIFFSNTTLSSLYPDQFEGFIETTLRKREERQKEDKRYIIEEEYKNLLLMEHEDYFALKEKDKPEIYVYIQRKHHGWDN